MEKLDSERDLGPRIIDLNGKIEMLLTGEDEANKLIEQILPNIEKIKADVEKVEER